MLGGGLIPEITDEPPSEIKDELNVLCDTLDQEPPLGVPAKIPDRNLLIGTWNLRAFGDLTESWRSQETDSPKRDLHALRCITEIVSRFDVIALQEVKGNLKCLRHMLKALGPDWMFIMTDVTRGAPGNDERMAFVFDTRKVQISGLACELVVPKEQLDKIGPDALNKQFARTPYAVSFRSAGKTFILVTLHVIYGNIVDRVPELKAIAEWLAQWAKDVNAWDHNLITLGDFNIDRRGDKLYEAFTSTGLQAPEDMQKLPRTIFSDPNKPDTSKFYDQIAWFTGNNNLPALSLKYMRGGNFDFTNVAMKSLNLTKQQLSYRISDHYPLWTEFQVRD
jgi:endonuclease/exonuclease/phosphatase family metal-dependent hydrolase